MAELSSSPAQAVVWDDVSKVYPGGQQAVRGVSLSVARGEILALLGTSGSGKTTLLKMVNALMEPSSGRVVVRDRCTTEWDPIALRRSIGYVIQEGGLMPHLSVLDNVGLAARAGWPGPGAVRPGLSPAAQRRSAAASGGRACAGGELRPGSDGRALRRPRPDHPARAAG